MLTDKYSNPITREYIGSYLRLGFGLFIFIWGLFTIQEYPTALIGLGIYLIMCLFSHAALLFRILGNIRIIGSFVIDNIAITVSVYAMNDVAPIMPILFVPLIIGCMLQPVPRIGIANCLFSVTCYFFVVVLQERGILAIDPLGIAADFSATQSHYSNLMLFCVSIGLSYFILDISVRHMRHQMIIEQNLRKSEAEARKHSDLLKSQLENTQRLESLGRLAGGVAHDFNNLLTVIIAYTEFLKETIDPENSEQTEYIDEVEKAAERATNLTSQLLAFSRKKAVKVRRIKLNETIMSLQNMLVRLINKNVTFELNLEKNLWYIRADSTQIEQVVLNLTINARDAMPSGGTITITTRNVYLDEKFQKKHPDIRIGNHILLTIQDTGTGIGKEVLDNIFEPFFTTKERGKGTGLGLAIVYGVVKQAGGHLTVESTLNVGTAFNLYFPKAELRIDTHDLMIRPSLPGYQKEIVVLVVDDEKKILEIAEKILQQAGHKVFTASNGEKAIEFVKNYEGALHLLLTDIVMPGINGKDMSEKILKLKPELQVIYMSGYTSELDGNTKFFEEDGPLLLEKPFNVQSLNNIIKQAFLK